MTAWTADADGVDVWFGDEVFTLVDPENQGITISRTGTFRPRATCWCGVDLQLIIDTGAIHHAPNPDGSAYSATSELPTPPCRHWA